jgi:hypothetical protein
MLAEGIRSPISGLARHSSLCMAPVSVPSAQRGAGSHAWSRADPERQLEDDFVARDIDPPLVVEAQVGLGTSRISDRAQKKENMSRIYTLDSAF